MADFVVTDTVGYKEVPTQLVPPSLDAEVARDADVTVVCADASSVELEEDIQTVTRTLVPAVETELALGHHYVPQQDGPGLGGACRGVA